MSKPLDHDEVGELPAVLGVAEVVLNVDDLPGMREFYTQVLGFALHSEASMESETPDPQGIPTICFLTIAEVESPLGRNGHPQLLALIDFQRHVFAKRFGEKSVSGSPLNHLAFEISPSAYPVYLRHLEQHQLSVTPVEFPNMHAKALFFDDPEGNRLELIAYAGIG